MPLTQVVTQINTLKYTLLHGCGINTGRNYKHTVFVLVKFTMLIHVRQKGTVFNMMQYVVIIVHYNSMCCNPTVPPNDTPTLSTELLLNCQLQQSFIIYNFQRSHQRTNNTFIAPTSDPVGSAPTNVHTHLTPTNNPANIPS